MGCAFDIEKMTEYQGEMHGYDIVENLERLKIKNLMKSDEEWYHTFCSELAYDYNERKWIYYRSDALKDEATGTEEIGNTEEILLSKESLDKLKRQVSDKEMLQDIDRNKTLIRIVYTRYENNDVYNGVQLEDFYLYYQQ